MKSTYRVIATAALACVVGVSCGSEESSSSQGSSQATAPPTPAVDRSGEKALSQFLFPLADEVVTDSVRRITGKGFRRSPYGKVSITNPNADILEKIGGDIHFDGQGFVRKNVKLVVATVSFLIELQDTPYDARAWVFPDGRVRYSEIRPAPGRFGDALTAERYGQWAPAFQKTLHDSLATCELAPLTPEDFPAGYLDAFARKGTPAMDTDAYDAEKAKTTVAVGSKTLCGYTKVGRETKISTDRRGYLRLSAHVSSENGRRGVFYATVEPGADGEVRFRSEPLYFSLCTTLCGRQD